MKVILTMVSAIFFLRCFALEKPTLHFIQVTSSSSNSYVLGMQMEQLNNTVDIVVNDFRKKNKSCSFNLKKELLFGNEEDLFRSLKKTVDSIKKGEERAFVGFSRSPSAKVAAKALVGTPHLGVSIGAMTDELQSINPHFISIAGQWEEQYKSIQYILQYHQCKPEKTYGVFDSADIVTNYFLQKYNLENPAHIRYFGELQKSPKMEQEILKGSCLFIGMSLPSSLPVLSWITSKQWKGTVVGTGDWHYFSPELKLMIKKNPKLTFNIYTPNLLGKDSSDYEKRVKLSFRLNPSSISIPMFIYTFDAITIALNHLCYHTDVLSDSKEWGKMGLVRKYQGLSKTGNLISDIGMLNIVEYYKNEK